MLRKKPDTDKVLFKAVKENSMHAFEVLFNLYYAPLCNYAMTIVKEKVVAEELVSDFFFRIWKNRENITITYTVKGYFLFAVRNTCLNYLKSRKQHTPVSIEDIPGLKGISRPEPENPLDLLIHEEVMEEWKKKINLLPRQRRKVFLMNKFEGKDFKTIARELSLSEKTVRNHLQLAIRTLSSLWSLFFLFLTIF